jgi:UDP-N-acetylmuramoyl-tripeptide--D-alanyl-D-alanine ligase
MDVRSIKFITAACSGQLLVGATETGVHRVCIDSRQVRPGDLFFALPGNRFDGHEFAGEAVKKGAVVIVGERQRLPADLGESQTVRGDCSVVLVDDVRKALAQLAIEYRRDFKLPVIAVGGSNGKTTTKELVASVLRQRLRVLWSEASFNNEIGVPLTLLRLDQSHQAAVLEAGTNHPGELAPLVRMIDPKYGIITCIGREHLEFFGNLAGVAQEEGTLAEQLPADGKLYLSGDDTWADRLAERTQAAVVRVGFSAGNNWHAHGLRLSQSGITFQVKGPTPDFVGEYRINLLGRHQVMNALFAIALGAELGLSREAVRRGLAECKAPKMRLELWELGGVRVLDDAYNSNSDSALAALQTLIELPCQGRRVAVLGDMAELGASSEASHEEVGRRAAEMGIGQLFAVGKMAPVIAHGARGAGLNRVLEFEDVETAGLALKSFVRSGDVVLLKASRATHLERIAEILRRTGVPRKN